MAESSSTVQLSRQGRVTVVSLQIEDYGNFAEEGLASFRQELLDCVDCEDEPRIVLDFSKTTFFASQFLSILLRAWQRVVSKDGSHMGLCCLSHHCAQVIRDTQLSQLWDVSETLEEAIAKAEAS